MGVTAPVTMLLIPAMRGGGPVGVMRVRPGVRVGVDVVLAVAVEVAAKVLVGGARVGHRLRLTVRSGSESVQGQAGQGSEGDEQRLPDLAPSL